MIQLMTTAGDAHPTPAGNLSVNVIYIGYGAGNHVYRVTVTRPGFCPQPVGNDDRSMGHADHTEAQALAEHYAAGLVELLTVEHAGISDERIAAVADGINTDLNAADAKRHTERVALEADVAHIMADAKPYRRVRSTRTHVFRKPLDPAQIRMIRQHDNGTVYAGNGIAWTSLRALADKGYGNANYAAGSRYRIESLTLNDAGWAIANETKEIAA